MRRVLVILLGESARAHVEAAVRQQVGAAPALEWLDRAELRCRPLRVLTDLMRRRYDVAVLVATDLRQPRLRLTSFLLALPRARQRWRGDLRGEREMFSTRAHLARNAWPIIRHLIACGLALVLGELLLRALDAALRLPTRGQHSRPRATQGTQPRPNPAPYVGRPHLTSQARQGRPSAPRPTPPRRVLYLRSQLWLGLAGGGSVAHTAGVIGGLERCGVDVQVVSSDHLPGVSAPIHVVAPETWFDGALRELEDLAYNVAFLAASVRVARWVRPDTLYQRHTAFNCAGAVLARVLRLPLVLEFNSSELWKGRYWGGLRFVRLAALVERINLRAAERIVVVSEVLRTQLVDAGVPADKILVNPNAVDADTFGPHVAGAPIRARLGVDPAALVVGFSGTFGLWHGIPTLAAALPLVSQTRPDVRWLLIGDGPLRPVVDEAIQRHQLQARVSLPGLVPHAEMPAYLAACDVLVSPHGRQADGGEFFGSPTKLFEYLATGRAIVASAVGQIAEVLQHEHNALLVQPDDPRALCAAIVRLVDDATLRACLGEHARRLAVERHTWRQHAERLLASLA